MNIAFISYHFYNQTAEGLVASKLAEALATRGHTVSVFSSAQKSYEWKQLKNLKIYKISCETSESPMGWRWIDQKKQKNNFWDKIAAFIYLRHGCDCSEWSWIQKVTKKVMELQKQNPFHIVHSRLNPALSHLAALQVKKSLSIPWCSYFSDPWPHHLYPKPYIFTIGPFARRVQERILHQILSLAETIIFPSEQLKNFLLQNKRVRFRSKACVAPHLTYLQLSTEKKVEDTSILKIRHAGFLMRERKIDSLYEAVRQWTQEQKITPSFLIEFAGKYHTEITRPPKDLQSYFQFHPLMSPQESMEWLKAGNICLLVEAKMKEGIFFPSKFSDYLSLRKPILALSPQQGVIADFLKEGGGIVVEPDDIQGLKKAFTMLYQLWQEEKLHELAPSSKQLHQVSPEYVIPIYEEAFLRAIKTSKGAQ